MMSNTLLQAYNTGKLIAIYKYAEESSLDKEEDLTPVLEHLVSGMPLKKITSEVKNDSEKVEKASWGDKIELEPGSATGIEV